MPYKQATTKKSNTVKQLNIVSVQRDGKPLCLPWCELSAAEKTTFYTNRKIEQYKQERQDRIKREKIAQEKRNQAKKARHQANRDKRRGKEPQTPQSTKKNEPFKGPLSFVDAFREKDKCVELFAGVRWKNGAYCAHCGSYDISPISSRKGMYSCNTCRGQFNALTGTIFANRQVPLYRMFLAMLYDAITEGGVSSNTLAKYLEITQKSAYNMLLDIRYVAMDQAIFSLAVETENGLREYEVDTTRRCGELYNVHAALRSTHGRHKQLFLIIKQRGGNVRVWPIDDEQLISMVSIIVDNLPQDLDLLCSDEAAAFKILGDIFPGRHKTVVHCKKDYAHDDVVIEDTTILEKLSIEDIVCKEVEMLLAGGEGLREVRVHTDSIEGYNGRLKSDLATQRNNVSKQHAVAYVNSSVFRQNTQDKSAFQKLMIMFENVARMAEPKGLVKKITQPESTTESHGKLVTMAVRVLNEAA